MYLNRRSGLTLDKDKKSEVWDPEVKSGAGDANESQGMRGEHTLLVKQVSKNKSN